MEQEIKDIMKRLDAIENKLKESDIDKELKGSVTDVLGKDKKGDLILGKTTLMERDPEPTNLRN